MQQHLSIWKSFAPHLSEREWDKTFLGNDRYLKNYPFLLSCSSLLTCIFLWFTTTGVAAQSCPLYPSPHQRIGFNVALEGGVTIDDYDSVRLNAGWYHDYRVQSTPSHPGGIGYHQMVRSSGRTTPAAIQQLLQQLGPVVDANPSAYWTLGNEPDRYGQDELTAAQYAVFYHDVYHFIKERDPSSRVAIAGIVQPTKLRLRYLDLVLSEYQQRYGQAMPVEIMEIHNFIMPENCSWGAGIPPGLEAHQNEGVACPATLNDHGSITLFQQQIRTFRQWMKDRGYRNSPLVVSEYGILLSKYHGYNYTRVRDFMLASFDFMLNTTDAQTGYAADGNRLVQKFAWFSLNYYEYNLATGVGLNGNLFDHTSRQIMPLGVDFENYTKNITVKSIDLAVQKVQADPSQGVINTPLILSAEFINQGSVAAQDVAVRFWNGDPRAGGQLLGATATQPQVLADCYLPTRRTFSWTPTQVGNYTIFAELDATNRNLESNKNNNYLSRTVSVANSGEVTPTPTPSASGYTYVSSSGNGKVATLSYQDEDIVRYNGDVPQWEFFFDGSDVGLAKNDVDAFEVQTDGSTPLGVVLLLSFDQKFRNLPGVGAVEDADIVKFIPTKLGSTTTGSFVLWLDGSTRGLDTPNEDIDAIAFDPTGRLIISTIGAVAAPSVTAQDEDLLVWDPATNSWQLYLDGSAMGLTKGSEDIGGAWIDAAGTNMDVYLSTTGNFSAASGATTVAGDSDDIFGLLPTGLPTNASLFPHFNGNAVGFTKAIDGISIAPANALASMEIQTDPTAVPVDDEATIQYEVEEEPVATGNEEETDEEPANEEITDEETPSEEPVVESEKTIRLFLPIVFE